MAYNRHMPDDRLHIRIGSALKRLFEERAEHERRSLTELVVRAMEQAAKRWSANGHA